VQKDESSCRSDLIRYLHYFELSSWVQRGVTLQDSVDQQFKNLFHIFVLAIRIPEGRDVSSGKALVNRALLLRVGRTGEDYIMMG